MAPPVDTSGMRTTSLINVSVWTVQTFVSKASDSKTQHIFNTIFLFQTQLYVGVRCDEVMYVSTVF